MKDTKKKIRRKLRRIKEDIYIYLFFFAWFICCCVADTMLDSRAAGVTAVVAMAVVIWSAVMINRKERKKCRAH